VKMAHWSPRAIKIDAYGDLCYLSHVNKDAPSPAADRLHPIYTYTGTNGERFRIIDPRPHNMLGGFFVASRESDGVRVTVESSRVRVVFEKQQPQPPKSAQ